MSSIFMYMAEDNGVIALLIYRSNVIILQVKNAILKK